MEAPPIIKLIDINAVFFINLNRLSFVALIDNQLVWQHVDGGEIRVPMLEQDARSIVAAAAAHGSGSWAKDASARWQRVLD